MNHSYTQTTDTTAGNPNVLKVQVGDFPYEPYHPTIDPYTPVPTPMPTTIPRDAWIPQNSWSGASILGSTNLPDPWKLEIKGDHIIATIDVPGCKAEGIELSLWRGALSVRATRVKGPTAYFEKYIGFDYNPEDAEAEVEDGVLTVKVMRLKEKISHKIAVKAK